MEIGNEISQKIRSAIKAKLVDLGAYVDDELPDYIMVMVANKKSQQQMTDDLNLFLGNNTEKFTAWLHSLLTKLKSIASEPSGAAKEVKAEENAADSASTGKSSGKDEEDKVENSTANDDSDEPVLTIRPEIENIASKQVSKIVVAEELIRTFIENIDNFKKAKMRDQVKEFYKKVGVVFGGGEASAATIVENFLKKIGADYDAIVKQHADPGGGSSTLRKLRGSESLYKCYEEYHKLYYPSPTGESEQTMNDETTTDLNQTVSTEATANGVAESSDIPDTPASPTSSLESPAQSPAQTPADSPTKDIDQPDATNIDMIESTTDSVDNKRPCDDGDEQQDSEAPEAKKARTESESGSSEQCDVEITNALGGPEAPPHLQTSVQFQEQYLQCLNQQNSLLGSLVSELRLLRQAYYTVHNLESPPDNNRKQQ